ncbi:hypothetical protein [Peterkaempfera griseoplana]|uniref:hypothetical protein n=1 Tax=Peterkaempfera griseoplana TaxID=66896 RepID=UPI0006E18D06|nr:hypothetical protein [Peterkaempfera griseoplana]
MTSEVVCYALTAAGLVVALLTAVRRRYVQATRWTAVALLPAGAYLAGLVPTLRRIGHALADWATALVLDPRVWTGLGLLALSLVLFAAARIASRRRTGRPSAGAPSRAVDARAAGTGAPAAVGRPVPAPGAEPAPKPASKPSARAGGDDLGDFSEIEEILRKRGI